MNRTFDNSYKMKLHRRWKLNLADIHAPLVETAPRAYFVGIYLEKLVGSLVWEPTNICMLHVLFASRGAGQGSQSGFHLWRLQEHSSLLRPFKSLEGSLYPVVCLPRKLQQAVA
jgi:hypothetical protein